MNKTIFSIMIIVILSRGIYAAHYIVGQVEDALNGESANGKTITLWNPTNGLLDNLTDTIGPTGNSGTDHTYMIDCELLQTPCVVGDTISVQVLTNGFYSNQSNVTVTGAGYNLQSNITLNSPTEIGTIFLDDNLLTPANEIDLTPASTKKVTCSAIITDYDGESDVSNITARFFDNSISSLNDNDDNNYHYTNNSCIINTSYGTTNEINATCTFNIQYYANPGTWNCTIITTDIYNITKQKSETTTINELLALGVDSPIAFGKINATEVSDEVEVNVTNYGNIEINLSLSGYAQTEGDGYAMNCTTNNINVTHQKYNLTASTPGSLTYSQFSQYYLNLTSTQKVNYFALSQRTNDLLNNAIKPTYWRIYVPEGVGGTCTGNTFFGAVKAPAD